jgi:hypothetical protein
VLRAEPAVPSSVAVPRRRGLVPLAIGVLAFAVYLANLRPMGAADANPTRLLPFSILREGNLDLDEFYWLRFHQQKPYFLKRDSAGHWRSKYPIVTPLLVTPLALPFVWWSQAWNITDDDARFRLVVAIFDRVAAALLAASSVVVVFLGARRLAPVPAATAAALVYAFGTNTWAISSQSLWQHALAELAIAGAALCVLHREGARTALLAGVCVGLAVGARPQSAIVAPFFVVLFWAERRRDLKFFLAAPALMFAALVGYNVTVLQRVTGGYNTRSFDRPNLAYLGGLLISPSRGLFVYCPLAILAFTALRRRTDHPARALRYFAAAIVGYLLFYASFRNWWAGHSYGPRFLIDILPLVALCALPAAERLWARPLPRALVIAGALWCLGVQIIGVYCDDNQWNRFPVSVDANPDRVWDWTDPQIVRAARSGWHGGELAPLLRQLLVDRTPAPLVPLEWDDLQATIQPLGTPWRFRAHAGGPLEVRITNRSPDAVWPAFSDFGDLQVGLAVVWKASGVIVQGVGDFQPLQNHLAPGAATEMHAWIEAPPQRGRYDLELNLVQSLGTSGRFGGVTQTVIVIVE